MLSRGALYVKRQPALIPFEFTEGCKLARRQSAAIG